jgi:hypothetical protein
MLSSSLRRPAWLIRSPAVPELSSPPKTSTPDVCPGPSLRRLKDMNMLSQVVRPSCQGTVMPSFEPKSSFYITLAETDKGSPATGKGSDKDRISSDIVRIISEANLSETTQPQIVACEPTVWDPKKFLWLRFSPFSPYDAPAPATESQQPQQAGFRLNYVTAGRLE